MPPTSFTLLRAQRLFDGSGAAHLEGAALLIEGVSIRTIGPAADVRAPDGAAVTELEYGDATILPGLVDVHTHMMGLGDGTLGDDVAKEGNDILLLQAAKNARQALRSGVTTARENGAKDHIGFSIKEGIRRGLADGPRLVVSGRPITMTGGHMWYCGSEADGEAEVRAEVRQLIKEGADFIKIMATGGTTRSSFPGLASYTVAELAAANDEAHRFGRLTAAHCSNIYGISNALDAGIDMIIHCMFEDEYRVYAWNEELAERLAAAGASVNPTLHVARSTVWGMEALIEANGPTPELIARRDAAARSLEGRLEVTGRLAKMGVQVTAGSDSAWGYYPAGLFVHEIQLMADAGMTNSEALVSATSSAAASIAMGEVAGLLAEGRQADILVVDGNPLDDIAALWNVRDVFKAGARVERGRE